MSSYRIIQIEIIKTNIFLIIGVILYTIMDHEALKTKLREIGGKSLLIINNHRDSKNETWETAVEINQIAHDLHDLLFEREDRMWDEFIQYCKNQENILTHE